MDKDKYKHNTGYSNTLLQGFNSLREDSQLCDVVIKVGGRDFPAHRAVLAATCNYFKAMFTSGFKESQQQEIQIDGNPDAFEVLLEFVYTGRIYVTKVKNHMLDLFQISLYMDFKDCSSTCSEVLTELIRSGQECVTVDEVCKILFLAGDHDNGDDLQGLWDLVEAAQDFLIHNLETLKDTEEFMQNATLELLDEFLCNEDLANEKEEKQVLELVVNWLKSNWEKRKDYTLQLLQKLRLGLVSTDDMKELMGAEIYAIPGCSELLSKVEKLRDSGKSKYILATEELELFATRSSITVAVVAVQQERHIHPNKASIYCQYARDDDDEWWTALENFAPLPDLIHLSFIVADGRLYAAGNKYYSRDSADFHRYDAEENKWISLPSTSKDMEHSQTVYLDGFIYIIGGGFSRLAKDVVRYDVSENRWEKVQQLPINPRAVSAVVFKDRIFCSVLNLDSNPVLNHYKLLAYNPSKDVWQEMVTLKECNGFSSGFNSFNSRVGLSLFIHKEQCYQIVTQIRHIHNDMVTITGVKMMNLQICDDGEIICTIKDEIAQDPESSVNSFRIHDEVFEYQNGSIYKKKEDIGCYFNGGEMSSNIVTFTFDKRKVL